MNLVLYTNSVSAHELPLAREIVRLIGAENFRYVYTGRMQGGGQEVAASEPWIASEDETTDALLRQCDVLDPQQDSEITRRTPQPCYRTNLAETLYVE